MGCLLFTPWVVCDSLWPRGLQHTRLLSVLHCLEELAQIHDHWVGDAIQLSRPLLPPSPPALNLSRHQGLICWAGFLHQVTRGIGASASPSVFRVDFLLDWLLYLLDVQGILQRLLQHHNLKASVLWCSVFFMAQLSHPYMTAWKTIAVTTQTLVGKDVFLLFSTPSGRVPWGNLYKLWESHFPLLWNRLNSSSDRNGLILKADNLHKLPSGC